MVPVRKSLPVLFSLLTAVTILLAACAPAGSNQPPAAVATAVPAVVATLAPVVPVTAPTAVPPAQPAPSAQPAPTSSIPETVAPLVKVSDQAITNGAVTVDSVVSPGPGWIVIHINSGGTPGAIIGWTQVNPGINNKVAVTIDTSKATPVLYAMLHTDGGVVGTYEFPGPDTPVMLNGQMVSPAFGVTGSLSGSSASGTTAPAQPTAAGAYGSTTEAPGTSATAAPSGTGGSSGQAADVVAAVNPKLGKILVDSKGMTLYLFKKDAPGVSNCTGGCAENWPPLLTTSGNPTAAPDVTGKLGAFARTDNGTQVTYNNQPLYYFAGDKAAGDVNGQGVGNSWFAATP